MSDVGENTGSTETSDVSGNTGSTETSDVSENTGSTGNEGEDEDEDKDDNDDDDDDDKGQKVEKVERVDPGFQAELTSSLVAERGTQARLEDLDEDAEPSSAQASGLFRAGNDSPESSALSDLPPTQGDPSKPDETDEYSMELDVPVGESHARIHAVEACNAFNAFNAFDVRSCPSSSSSQ